MYLLGSLSKLFIDVAKVVFIVISQDFNKYSKLTFWKRTISFNPQSRLNFSSHFINALNVHAIFPLHFWFYNFLLFLCAFFFILHFFNGTTIYDTFFPFFFSITFSWSHIFLEISLLPTQRLLWSLLKVI